MLVDFTWVSHHPVTLSESVATIEIELNNILGLPNNHCSNFVGRRNLELGLFWMSLPCANDSLNVLLPSFCHPFIMYMPNQYNEDTQQNPCIQLRVFTSYAQIYQKEGASLALSHVMSGYDLGTDYKG